MKLFWFKDKGHSEFLFKEVTLYSYVNIVENKGFWMQEDKKRSNNLSGNVFFNSKNPKPFLYHF
jgi:hypothetical protein